MSLADVFSLKMQLNLFKNIVHNMWAGLHLTCNFQSLEPKIHPTNLDILQTTQYFISQIKFIQYNINCTIFTILYTICDHQTMGTMRRAFSMEQTRTMSNIFFKLRNAYKFRSTDCFQFQSHFYTAFIFGVEGIVTTGVLILW